MRIIKFLVLAALLLVPPVLFCASISGSVDLTQRALPLFTPSLNLFFAADHPVSAEEGEVVYQLSFPDQELWGSKEWYFAVNRQATQEEMREVLVVLDGYISNPDYPLEPIMTDYGKAYTLGTYNTVIWGKYTLWGNVVNIFVFIVFLLVCLWMTARLSGGIVDIFGVKSDGLRGALKRELTAFSIFMTFGVGLFLALAFRRFGLSLSLALNFGVFSMLMVVLYPVYLVIDVAVLIIRKIVRKIKQKKEN